MRWFPCFFLKTCGRAETKKNGGPWVCHRQNKILRQMENLIKHFKCFCSTQKKLTNICGGVAAMPCSSIGLGGWGQIQSKKYSPQWLFWFFRRDIGAWMESSWAWSRQAWLSFRAAAQTHSPHSLRVCRRGQDIEENHWLVGLQCFRLDSPHHNCLNTGQHYHWAPTPYLFPLPIK